MRVCHVCSAHPADDSRVFHRACVSLARAGYDVHLLAVSQQPTPYRVQGVTIHALPVCQTRRERFARRDQVARMAAELKPDLFHVHEPELLGSTLTCSGSRPVIYDVHESYLDIIAERDWIPPWAKPFVKVAWDTWERRLARRCAAIVTATDHIGERYLALHSRVVSIRNFTDVSPDLRQTKVAERDGRTCVFAGTILSSANLSNTIHALGLLRRRGVAARLWLAGRISESYKRHLLSLASSEGVSEQVKYFGVLPRAEAVSLQASASIGLVNFSATPNTRESLPIRMLECMALGLPLVYSDFPAFRKIAGACEAGIAVDPAEPEQTADAIKRLIQEPQLAQAMGQAGMRAVSERFNWQAEQVKLLELYSEILGNTKRHSLTPALDNTCTV